MMKKQLLYWILPIAWMGIIFYSSATPYEQQDMKPLLGDKMDVAFLEPLLAPIDFTYNGQAVSLETHGVEGMVEFYIRKAAHVGVFFVLTLLFKLTLGKTTSLRESQQLTISFFLTVAYAIMDEFHQSLTPNRTPYVGDVLLDSIGGLLAVGIWLIKNKFK